MPSAVVRYPARVACRGSPDPNSCDTKLAYVTATPMVNGRLMNDKAMLLARYGG